jgi:hypothetical protein
MPTVPVLASLGGCRGISRTLSQSPLPLNFIKRQYKAHLLDLEKYANWGIKMQREK